MKGQKSFSLVLLLAEVAFTLFISGIVLPSLLRSDLATKEALAMGFSVHSTSQGLRSRTRPKMSHGNPGRLSRHHGSFCCPFSRHYARKQALNANNHLQTAHHASPLTGLAETVNRDSASVVTALIGLGFFESVSI